MVHILGAGHHGDEIRNVQYVQINISLLRTLYLVNAPKIGAHNRMGPLTRADGYPLWGYWVGGGSWMSAKSMNIGWG